MARRLSGHGGLLYIVTNHKKGTLYIGVTSDLEGCGNDRSERRVYRLREIT